MPSKNKKHITKIAETVITLKTEDPLDADMMSDPNDKNFDAEFNILFEKDDIKKQIVSTITFKNASKFSKKFHLDEELVESLYRKVRNLVIDASIESDSITNITLEDTRDKK